jgi:citrate synthase
MATLQEVLQDKIPVYRDRVQELLKNHGQKVVSEVTIAQTFGGMRGVKAMICDTSEVDPEKGLSVRGHSILDIQNIWPEEMLFLLLTGELPNAEGKAAMQREFDRRSQVPHYVWDTLKALPKDTCPMAMLATGILIMNRESVFRKWYHAGMKPEDYWLAMLEDSLNILAKMPVIAAGIYRIRYDHGSELHWTHGLDLGANFANMLGIADPKGVFARLMRLFMTLHADHEGGNVSANTTTTVGSALSDAYYSISAGLNGLAGPLHGLANQECVNWILDLMQRFNGVPSEEQLREYAFETLRSGLVIPGYGHAVLRVTDPRFTGFHEFGKQHLPEDPVFKTVDVVYKVVPQVLTEYSEERVKAGKKPIANIWPNLDAVTGSLLHHFGLLEQQYYTVLFAVSRSLGLLSQLVLDRALGEPIRRPKSVSTNWLFEFAGQADDSGDLRRAS